jgi:tetratricopeptide (TPR) repeat protein
LLLIPWISLNWRLHRKIIPFEYGAAHSNIVSGALGLEQTMEGDISALMSKGLDTSDTAAVLKWAAGEVSRHPARYIGACIRRTARVFSWHPMICLLGLLGCWFGRSRRDVRELGFLCLYYLVIHCLMAIEPRYFFPFWPLLLALAAGGSASFSLRMAPLAGRFVRRSSVVMLSGCLVLAVAFAAHVCAQITAYQGVIGASPARQARLFDEEIKRHPKDPWLLSQRADARMENSDFSGAAQDLSGAADLEPQNQEYRLKLAWARWLGGDHSALRRFQDDFPSSQDDLVLGQDSIDISAHVLAAYAEALQGNPAAARSHVEQALSHQRSMLMIRGRLGPRELEILRGQREYSRRLFMSGAGQLVGQRPLEERLPLAQVLLQVLPPDAFPLHWLEEPISLFAEASGRKDVQALRRVRRLVARIAQLDGLDPEIALKLAGLAVAQGWGREACLCLRQSAREPDVPRRLLAAALLYQRLGRNQEALALWNRLVLAHPADALYLSDRAVTKALLGRKEAAIRDLRSAITAGRRLLQSYLSLGTLLAGAGQTEQALGVYEEALHVADPIDANVIPMISNARDKLLAVARKAGTRTAKAS